MAAAISSSPVSPQRFAALHIAGCQKQSIDSQRLLSSASVCNEDLKLKLTKKVEQARHLVLEETDPKQSLLMVDSLQRLGIDYHFSEEIHSLLAPLQEQSFGSLHDAALAFRLLRQHGSYISPGVFDKFKDGKGRFREEMTEDVRGMLALYEASFLDIEGEDSLVEARDFTREHLKAWVMDRRSSLAEEVEHALENPFHPNIPRFSMKFHLHNSVGGAGKINPFHELAKLDFNTSQALHQIEVRKISRWWREMGLDKQLKFARIQPWKWFMWTSSVLPHVEFSEHRVQVTKPLALVYIIDDIFDTHGTMDELVLFTEAINRWEDDAVNKLPEYMKLCFNALHNTTNEIAEMVLKEHGWNPLSALRKSWAMLCDAFLVEAKWFASGHCPTADEYLRNGVISTGVPMVLHHFVAILGERQMVEGKVDVIDNTPGFISCPSTILRLWDDLGCAKDENQEGNDGSYIDCYMQERGRSFSNQRAREHVMHLVGEEWKKLNKECLTPNHFSPAFRTASLNVARMVPLMYSYNENHRLPALEEQINSSLLESIALQITEKPEELLGL